MITVKARLLRIGRWGLLAGLLALGVTLVFSAWKNRRETQQISALLDRGQAERFFDSIPQLHQENRGNATSADLAKLVEQFRDEGLRYLVEYSPNGRLLAEAGEHVGSARPRPSTSQQPIVFGERVRVTFLPPRQFNQRPHREPPPPPPDEQRGPPRDAHAPDDRGPPPEGRGPPPEAIHLPDLVLEFEPTVANQLRSRATNTFIFSITAAASLLALTLGLWLALVREERRRERSERERHLTALGEMSAVLAHEIRNPLASLKGHAQLLGEQLGAESPLHKKVDRIVDEAKRLEELTSTLLDLVRASSVSPQPTDPAQLLRNAADAVDGSHIDVSVQDAPSNWLLDPLRMQQVLENLMQNAVQASPSGSKIEASVGMERGRLVMRVRDRGPGLPAGSEERVFEAFHTTRVKGTGLGLAVARRIVELHGGKITGENHADGGAVFTLWLPS